MCDDRYCIEVELLLGRKPYSVKTYEAALAKAGSLSNVKALSFHEVLWTVGAPPVHKLTSDWQATKESAKVRVRDPDVYHAQMLELMGLGDLLVEDTERN